MKTTSTAKEDIEAQSVKKSWKDYIGWAGFVITVGVLLQQLYTHGGWFWYYSLGSGTQVYATLGDPQYSILSHIATIYDLLAVAFFTLYSFAVLVLLLLRKKIVPRLLVIFACAAIISNATNTVLSFLLAAEYNEQASLHFTTILFVVIDIMLLIFYTKSRQFKALFVK